MGLHAPLTKYLIEIEELPNSDAELIAAVTLVLQLAGAPIATKAAAIRTLASFSARLGQFETSQFRRHSDRTPIIKGPIDPEPGFNKVWRLIFPPA